MEARQRSSPRRDSHSPSLIFPCDSTNQMGHEPMHFPGDLARRVAAGEGPRSPRTQTTCIITGTYVAGCPGAKVVGHAEISFGGDIPGNVRIKDKAACTICVYEIAIVVSKHLQTPVGQLKGTSCRMFLPLMYHVLSLSEKTRAAMGHGGHHRP